jgi:hypothetical protein
MSEAREATSRGVPQTPTADTYTNGAWQGQAGLDTGWHDVLLAAMGCHVQQQAEPSCWQDIMLLV